MVSPAWGIWKDFIQERRIQLPFNGAFYPEAIRYLARKYNIEIEETELTDAEKSKYRSKESMYLVSDFAKDYFHHTLLKTEEGKQLVFRTLRNMVLPQKQ
jgi:DNA primase